MAYLVGCESCLVAHDVSEHAAEVPPAAHEGAAVQVVGQRGVRAVGPLVDARHGLVGPARTLGTEDHGRAERRAAGKPAGRHAGIVEVELGRGPVQAPLASLDLPEGVRQGMQGREDQHVEGVHGQHQLIVVQHLQPRPHSRGK